MLWSFLLLIYYWFTEYITTLGMGICWSPYIVFVVLVKIRAKSQYPIYHQQRPAIELDI